jgi:hypothetical protein
MMKSAFERVLEERFGVLKYKGHDEGGEGCAMEVASVARGVEWTDDPGRVDLPDLRPLNDARWSSDEARTKNVVPVVVALWDWPEWGAERRQRFVLRLAELTIRRVLPVALRAMGLVAEAKMCQREGSEKAAARAGAMTIIVDSPAEYAYDAIVAAGYAYPESASTSAHAAANSAASAARLLYTYTADNAGVDALLALACECWVQAARESMDNQRGTSSGGAR